MSEITAISKLNTKLLKIMLFTLSVNSLHRTLYVVKILFCYIVDGHFTVVCICLWRDYGLVNFCTVCALVVPSRPRLANVTKVLPTMVELNIERPEEDGGMPITHYVVDYENESMEFIFGLHDLLSPCIL